MVAGKIRTKLDKSGELVVYSEAAVRNNAAIVEYCRTSMAALSGGTAGLLGLTGLYGFGFYIFAVFGLWGLLLMKAGSQWKKYFINRKSLLTNGFFYGLFRPMYYFGHSFMEWFTCIKSAIKGNYLQCYLPEKSDSKKYNNSMGWKCPGCHIDLKM